jgi:hypothetical protein
MHRVDAVEGRDGLMVLVLWIEPSGRVVLRISSSTNARLQRPDRSYASTKTQVLQAVERWLDAFVTPP